MKKKIDPFDNLRWYSWLFSWFEFSSLWLIPFDTMYVCVYVFLNEINRNEMFTKHMNKNQYEKIKKRDKSVNKMIKKQTETKCLVDIIINCWSFPTKLLINNDNEQMHFDFGKKIKT